MLRGPADAVQTPSALPAGEAVAWLRTLVAKGPQSLQREHLRHRPVAPPSPRLHVIALDVSGSMRRGGRLASAKGHAALLIEQAARAGDDVALLSFGGRGAQWLMRPGPARRSGSARVQAIGGGGGTPLAAALAESDRLLARRRGASERWLWLLTDGRSLEQPVAPSAAEHIVIIDFDRPTSLAVGPLSRCVTWAARWGAEHRPASLPVA